MPKSKESIDVTSQPEHLGVAWDVSKGPLPPDHILNQDSVAQTGLPKEFSEPTLNNPDDLAKNADEAEELLMDKVEASAKFQGVYFGRWGKKTSDSDTRVLGFRKNPTGNRGLVVLTIDGPKFLGLNEDKPEEEVHLNKILEQRIAHENNPDDFGATEAGYYREKDTIVLAATMPDGVSERIEFPRGMRGTTLRGFVDLDENSYTKVVEEAISKSVEMTAPPPSFAEKNKQKIEQAESLSKIVDNLPLRD
ncbi:MAG: hypothetical protein AAB531_03665 [Patescibacteria group bacterium]